MASAGSGDSAGKIELGGFQAAGRSSQAATTTPVGFNVYRRWDFTYCFNPKVAIEVEATVGWAQDVYYHNAKVIHVQMPGVWSQFGNVVIFPGGTTGKRVPYYITGGAGLLQLQSRVPTKQFGYDVDTVGWESFVSENIGGGIKIFRAADAPNWGFRVDYRHLHQFEEQRAGIFCAVDGPHGPPRLRWHALYLETIRMEAGSNGPGLCIVRASGTHRRLACPFRFSGGFLNP